MVAQGGHGSSRRKSKIGEVCCFLSVASFFVERRRYAHEGVERFMTRHACGVGNDSIEKEEVATMIRSVMAMVVFVRDLDRCAAFYRDMLGLELKESDADSASFALGNQYLILLKTPAASQMISAGAISRAIWRATGQRARSQSCAGCGFGVARIARRAENVRSVRGRVMLYEKLERLERCTGQSG